MALGNLKEAEASFIQAEQMSKEIHNVTNWVKALLELWQCQSRPASTAIRSGLLPTDI
ncbi:MAG: hypothetical protein R3B83_02675 [Nitrospirales bacterium]|nr:hypothetical protein [Nitrospirales bacterium]